MEILKRFRPARHGEVISVEAKRDVVRHFRSGQLSKARGVQDEEKGRSLLGIQHDREYDPVVLIRRLRCRHEHGFSGVTALLVPRGGHITLEVQLHEVVDEVFPYLVPSPVDVAVTTSRAASIVNAGK